MCNTKHEALGCNLSGLQVTGKGSTAASSLSFALKAEYRLIMPSRQASGVVVSRIEAVLESVLRQIGRNEQASVRLASKRADGLIFDTVRFPGRTSSEARKFARLILILQLAHDALVSGTILTKRNVFYQNQDLFSEQSQVNKLVDAIALTFDVGREDLNIIATSKGMLAGPVLIRLANGSALNLAVGDAGIAIPMSSTVDCVNLAAVRWVLVLEKDAVFRTLTSARYWEVSAAGPGLMVTAKGYPDLITRDFLQLVYQHAPHLPILVLADYDVDGINIVRCYRYSTDPTSRHEPTLNPSVQWLGIHTSQVIDLVPLVSALHETDAGEEPIEESVTTSIDSSSSLISSNCRNASSVLSQRDRRVAVGVLTTLAKIELADDAAVVMRSELQRMLMIGVKCEIQWLDDCGSLVNWLDQALLLAL